jgi:Domain of unknown function (DUF397)
MKLDRSRARWRKSSYSGNTGNCIEVSGLGPAIAVRDTKNPVGSVLTFPPSAWRRFTKDFNGSQREG